MRYLTLLLIMLPGLCLAGVPLDVKVAGVEDELKDNILLYLDIVKKKDEKELSDRWVKSLHKKAPEQINEALQPFGYYNPVIESSLEKVDGKWIAMYQVSAGEITRVQSVELVWQGEGADHVKLQQALKDYPLKEGDVLLHDQHEVGKGALLDDAFSVGFAKAEIIKSQVVVDRKKNSATISIVADTGSLYYFGEVSFKQDFLDPELLNHYNTLEPGEPYSHEALLEFQQNIIASNYAREVTLDPGFDSAENDKVPLDVIMRPIVPHKFSFGIGYETDIGPRGSVRWTDRLINSYGHHSEVYLKLASKERILSGEYYIPIRNPVTDRWVNALRYEYEETPTTISDTFLVETAAVRRNLDDTRFYKLFIDYSWESFTIGNDPSTETLLLIFGGTSRFSAIDEDMFPQWGYLVYSDLRGSSDSLLSDTSFTRLHLKGRYLFGFGENGRLDIRGEVGATWVDDFDLYPSSLRFFAGGDSSVRGYEYQSLGPENDEGIVVGGKHLLVASVEYDHRVSEKWVIAGFVDAGDAYNNKPDSLYAGAGVGVRWLAPFGALRVDFAWPVSAHAEDSDLMIHIGFGATL